MIMAHFQFLGLSLDAAADIAQIGIAATAIAALIFAAAQLAHSRTLARRDRAYQYADLLKEPEMIRAVGAYQTFWFEHTFAQFRELERTERLLLNMVPNVIEGAAWLYNRELLDRDVAAELIGAFVESLWVTSEKGIFERRDHWKNPRLFAEWEEMKDDTPTCRSNANKRLEIKRYGERLPIPTVLSPDEKASPSDGR
jgi:hypothetical protein